MIAKATRQGVPAALEALRRAALRAVESLDRRVGGVATVCLIAFVGVLMRDVADPTALGGWVVAVALAVALRGALSRAWRRHARSREVGNDPIVDRLHRREAACAASAFCAGLAWAAVPWLGVDRPAIGLPAALALTIALILGGASSAATRTSRTLYEAPIVLSQVLNLLLPGRAAAGWAGGLAVVSWLALAVVLHIAGRRSAATWRDGIAARAEHQRRGAEQAALLENLSLGVLVVRDARIAVCNDAVLRLFGYRRKEDLVGRSVRLLMPDEEAWREALEQSGAALRGAALPRIVRRRRADGRVIETLFRIAAVQGVDEATAFIGIYEDVQERRAAEETCREALRLQRLVFESAGEGIAIVRGGVIEQGNQALADLLGLTPGQMTDRPLRSVFEDPDEWSDIERRFALLGTTFKLERRILRVDGRGTWVNVTGRLVDEAPRNPPLEAPAGVDVKRSIWVFADLSTQKHRESENWHHANHDVMTGLPNRRFLQDRLDQALASARRDGRRVAAVELDLDGFKSINDRHGHRFGDAVLEEVARRLSSVVRELDAVGRWGGDEFVLVLRDVESRAIVEETVRRVIARLSEPILHGGQRLAIGASVGIALYPEHGQDVEALMLAADLSMYESKSAGGNTWRFAASPVTAPRGKYRPAAAAPAAGVAGPASSAAAQSRPLPSGHLQHD